MKHKFLYIGLGLVTLGFLFRKNAQAAIAPNVAEGETPLTAFTDTEFMGDVMFEDIRDAQSLTESSDNPNAFNKGSGATGLFQITKPVLTDYNKAHHTNYTMRDLYDPDLNGQVRDWYMAYLGRYFSGKGVSQYLTQYVLAAYNWGMGFVSHCMDTISEMGGDPTDYNNLVAFLPRETSNYVAKITGETYA